MRVAKRPHFTHRIRTSVDASSYDSICDLCGHTDLVVGGWGKLLDPCPKNRGEKK